LVKYIVSTSVLLNISASFTYIVQKLLLSVEEETDKDS